MVSPSTPFFRSLPHSQTFVGYLREQVQRQSEAMAFVFLKPGQVEDECLTYGELDVAARAIATALQARLAPAERVLLVYPYDAGLAFIRAFLGCLYAGMIAVPCAVPRNRVGWVDLGDRLQSSEAKLLLSTQATLPSVLKQLGSTDVPAAATLEGLATDSLNLTTADGWVAPDVRPETLAFLQYTSGSTGKPKGVMVPHQAILQNQRMICEAFGHGPHLVGMGWLPLFHDMGLIGNVLQPLFLGRHCILMSPMDFVQKPVRWLQAISRYRATTSGGPNFAYDLLCHRVTAAQRADLDLSCWEVAFSGAEPVLQQTVERFSQTFAECGFRASAFYPCYGMAEATLLIAGGKAGQGIQTCLVDRNALEQNCVRPVAPKLNAASRTFISCGQAWLDNEIVIAHPETQRRCAPDEVGEIWVRGSGLGVGYWNQPDLSDRTFRATLTGEEGDRPFLRTGDLGFLHDGNLYITGRMNDVLVFWGLNHYPQHIEQTVAACHSGFRANGTAAFSIDVAGTPRLVVAQEVARDVCGRLTLEEVLESVRWQVFYDHFIDLYSLVLLKPGSLPRTSSGKIQRHRCAMLFERGDWMPLAVWHNPKSTDMTGLVQRYLNPLTHFQRLSRKTAARFKRLLGHSSRPSHDA